MPANYSPALEALGMLRGGLVPRGPTSPVNGSGPWRALRAVDIAPDGTVDWARLGRLPLKDGDQRFQIHSGDLLLSLRAMPIRPVIVEGVPDLTLAFGHWAVLTPDPSLVHGQYLAWYLRHPKTVARLTRELVQGTRMAFLPLTGLRRFLVELPPLHVQRHIAAAAALHARTRELESRLAAARARLVDAVTWNARNAARNI